MDSFKVESQLLLLNPDLVRAKERQAANRFSINGVDLTRQGKIQEIGLQLVDYQAKLTVELIRQRSNRPN